MAAYEITWTFTCSGDDAAEDVFNAIAATHQLFRNLEPQTDIKLTKIMAERKP
jgi:hypothetical protein